MSDLALYASLAVNALGAIGGIVLAAKLATARQDSEDLEEANEGLRQAVVELKQDNTVQREANGAFLRELAKYRAAERNRVAQRKAALAKANAVNAARQAAKVNGGASAPCVR